jgi:hypothetical protein
VRRFLRWLFSAERTEAYSLGDFDGYLRGFEEGVRYGREWPGPEQYVRSPLNDGDPED